MSTAPRVSIGMPVYNGERFLREALESLLAQTFRDFEVVISDNASTDNTRAICEDYAARDPRIQYYRSEHNQGAAWNFNRVFELASGEYFKWFAHDDLLMPDNLHKSVDILDRHPDVVLCYSYTRCIDPDGNELDEYEFNGKYQASSSVTYERFYDIVIPYHWCFQIFGLIRREALAATPGMGAYLSADRVLLSHLVLLGRFYEIPEYLFESRRYPEQSGSMMLRPYAYMNWYSPKYKSSVVLPYWSEYLNYFRAVRAAPISGYQRLRCTLYLLDLTKHGRRGRYLVKDILIAGALNVAKFVTQRLQHKSRIASHGSNI